MSSDLFSLINPDTTIKVSSTLDKSVGKKYLIDDNPETCWTSQQGLPQSIQLTFAQRVIPKRVSLTFQGGFVGTQCAIYVDSDADKKEWRLLRFIYPEDVNKKQSFDLYPLESGVAVNGVGSVRLVFEQSSDFFGRITVYNLELEGITTAS
ncbi:galactose-binding like protein [Tricholoma matsutake]|nr:galactose-binding like protein [Tricholoma matsutake 945]